MWRWIVTHGEPQAKKTAIFSLFYSLSLCPRMVPPPFHPPPFSLWPLGRERSRRKKSSNRSPARLSPTYFAFPQTRQTEQRGRFSKKKIAHTATAEPGSVFSAPFALIPTLQDRDSPIGPSTEYAFHIFPLKIVESRGICRLTHGTAILLLFGMQSKVASAAAAF